MVLKPLAVFHQRINPLQPSVTFHIESSHLIYTEKQMTGDHMKCNSEQKWVKITASSWLHAHTNLMHIELFLEFFWCCCCIFFVPFLIFDFFKKRSMYFIVGYYSQEIYFY